MARKSKAPDVVLAVRRKAAGKYVVTTTKRGGVSIAGGPAGSMSGTLSAHPTYRAASRAATKLARQHRKAGLKVRVDR